MSIAPPKARRKTGVQRMSIGSSTRPMRSRSVQNASIRAFSARQKSSSSAGPDARPRWRRGRRGRARPRRPGPARRARQTGHRSRASRTISARTAANSRSAAARIRSGVNASERIVWRIFRANSSRAEPSVALARRQDAHREGALEGGERGLARGRGRVEPRPDARHRRVVGAASAAARASSISSPTPGSWSSAVSVWNRPTGRPSSGADERLAGAVEERRHPLQPSRRRWPAGRPAARTRGTAAGTGRRPAGTPMSSGFQRSSCSSSSPKRSAASSPRTSSRSMASSRLSVAGRDGREGRLPAVDEGQPVCRPSAVSIRPAAVVAVVADGRRRRPVRARGTRRGSCGRSRRRWSWGRV